MKNNYRQFIPSTLIGLLMFTGSLHASNGVIEINQTCAINGGCTAADTAGFPVSITEPGSYILTSNLQLPDADSTGIHLSGANPSTIDLNGFAILGPTVCTGAPSTDDFLCAPLGSGMGIDSNGTSLTLLNGSIIGIGAQGVRASVLAHIEDVGFRGTGGVAIDVGFNSTVHANRLFRCGGGINGGSSVTNNMLSLIGGDGIDASGIVSGNKVINVAGVGIDMLSGVASDNEVGSADDVGLDGGLQVGYKGNVFRNNNGGDIFTQVDLLSKELGTNICGQTTMCP